MLMWFRMCLCDCSSDGSSTVQKTPLTCCSVLIKDGSISECIVQGSAAGSDVQRHQFRVFSVICMDSAWIIHGDARLAGHVAACYSSRFAGGQALCSMSQQSCQKSYFIDSSCMYFIRKRPLVSWINVVRVVELI